MCVVTMCVVELENWDQLTKSLSLLAKIGQKWSQWAALPGRPPADPPPRTAPPDPPEPPAGGTRPAVPPPPVRRRAALLSAQFSSSEGCPRGRLGGSLRNLDGRTLGPPLRRAQPGGGARAGRPADFFSFFQALASEIGRFTATFCQWSGPRAPPPQKAERVEQTGGGVNIDRVTLASLAEPAARAALPRAAPALRTYILSRGRVGYIGVPAAVLMLIAAKVGASSSLSSSLSQRLTGFVAGSQPASDRPYSFVREVRVHLNQSGQRVPSGASAAA